MPRIRLVHPSVLQNFCTLLTPLLTRAFDAIDNSTLPSHDLLTANVSILMKPGKDPSQCSSYCPISLLNIDLKLFATVLANCLSPLLLGINHRDQSWICPWPRGPGQHNKTIHLISYVQRHRLQACLLSIYAEKAFDRVNWRFLRLSLEQLGLGSSFISKIMSLYSHPSASVLVNGTSSEAFDISNGTRQGCPLSPLLFVIVLEHLACALCQNASIQGVQTPLAHHRLSLYVNDLLIHAQTTP